MKLNYTVLVLASLLLFSGCLGLDGDAGVASYDGSHDYGEEAVYDSYAAPSATAGLSMQGASSSKGMVIKQGSISVNVEPGTLEGKKDELSLIMEQYDAELYSIYFDEYSYQKRYAITVKIPPSKFDGFLDSVSALGEITSMDTTLEDVTEQYTDIQTRIENLEEELARLNELYAQAQEIEDILLIEKEVTRVQTELEFYQTEAQDLERRSSKSTVTVYLIEEEPAIEKDFMMPLGEILNLFLGALSFGIMVVVGLVGFVLPIAAVAWVLRKAYRAITKKKGNGKKGK